MRTLASRQVVSAINDLLDNCAQVKRDQRVIIVGAVDGLYGGVNLVEEEVLVLRTRGCYRVAVIQR